MHLNDHHIKHLKRIVNYMFEEEKRHYEETDEPEGHIFESVQAIRRILPKASVIKY